ncbi:long-chain-fatty-acid--CoA ligase [Paractinoplanes atraurantiacus]|uniref:Long-chain acyl-CoA synthetase n=1 Tax=Paractinoplanes atraurantiacus TaxID=1036182 RepID=A0A285HTG4_9ACTN|nr:long-chain-fatty-acid--CoA ligase [Actinoplanes atraurantiacus]SNY38992.1 long-chain acyl-CoA synthetase [Actinoplanes atraurantiacus]
MADERPWLAAYPEGVPADIDEPARALTANLEGAVERFPDRIALDFLGATTTYAQLGDQVARAAEALRLSGVGPGDRVALILPNCPQHVVAFYAVLRLGAVVVEHNPLYTADELAHQLADHGATVAVCWEKAAATVAATAERTSITTIIGVDLTAALPLIKRLALKLPLPAARKMRDEMRGTLPGGTLLWETMTAEAPPIDASIPGPGVDDTALLQYTGGTSGTPKGAVLSHRNLVANAEQSRVWVPGLRDGGETFYAVLPLFHAYGLTLCLTTAVRIAATIVLMPRFDAGMVLDAVKRRPPTFFPGVPPMYDRLAAAARERGTDLSSIRFSFSGAMPLPAKTVETWEALTGGLLIEGYGMTETSPITVGNPMSERRRAGSIGVPYPSTYVRIADRDDVTRDMPAGEPGELLLKGPQVFSGYWNLPEETEAVLLPDGWIRTGDVAVMSDDGFLSIVDRVKELIITGGFNVYPSEVEDVVRDHPDVADVAVVGLPSERTGEEVVAVVVAAEGATVDREALVKWARERLSGYKAPRRCEVVDELPRSQIGKVLRRQVRDDLLAKAQ